MEISVAVLDLARFLMGAAVLVYAARSDLLTRRVEDWCWWLFLAAGLVILESQLLAEGEGFLFLLTPVYLLVFFVSLWYEGEVLGDGFKRRDSAMVTIALNLTAFTILGAQLAAGPIDPGREEGRRHLALFSVPLMMLAAYLLYRTQLLSGGADAKAFLALAVLVPFYPVPFFQVLDIPSRLQLICPFVLAIFFNAAFFTLFNPAGLFLYNLARGDRGRVMAFAYRIPIEEARKRKFIWLSECIQDGKRRYLYFRFRDCTAKWKRRQLALMEKEGESMVWVQPQIPFMVQLGAGFIFSFALGNIILFWMVRTIAGV